MKYEIGDKIIVLHSDEEGKVVEIINEKMVSDRNLGVAPSSKLELRGSSRN